MPNRLVPRAVLFCDSAPSILVVTSLIAVLLFLPNPADAQGLRWGVSASMTSAGFQGDVSVFAGQSMRGTELPAKFAGRRTGFGLGVNLRSTIRPWMAFRTALRYEQRGGTVERILLGPADGLVQETVEFQFDYLTTPLLVQVRFPRPVALNLRPSLYAGPALELNLRSRANRNYRTVRGERNFVSDVNTPPIGALAITGAEVAYPLSNGGDLALDVRYSFGLSDVVTENGTGVQYNTAQLGVRYFLP